MKPAVFLAVIATVSRSSFAQSTSATTTATVTAPITSPPGTASSSSSGPTTTTVSVGLNHAFIPDTISARTGDVIKFIFWPTNHSVVKAAYKYPCVPYDDVEIGQPTFFSGPMLSNDGDKQPTWTLTVNDTEPTFFYCSAPGSCKDQGMIGVINPNKDFTLDVQKAYWKNVSFQLSPGEPWPNEEPTPTPSSSAPAATSGSGSAGGGSGSGGSSLSAGAIAGIAIGGAAVVITVVALVWFCGRKGGIEKGYRKSTTVHPSTPGMVEASYPNDPKSPPPPSFRDSPYGVPTEAYRSTSPAQWSQTGSPHPSPGFHSGWQHEQHTGQSGFFDQTKPEQAAPVELPGNMHHTETTQQRHEFPG